MKYLSLTERDKKHLGPFIVSLILIITFLHYSTLYDDHNLHSIFSELYYIPIFLGALMFGLKGAVLTYALIIILYAPYMYLSWAGAFSSEFNKFLHVLLQGLLAIFSGLLIDGYKRHTERLGRESYLAGLGKASAAVAHDLKNPLITILGFAKRICEGKGKTDNSIQAITASALHMQRIIHDVLDFSKPLKLNLGREDIFDVLNRACNSCRTKAFKAGVELSINETEESFTLEMDSFHIERAIINLINNSIEASGRGDSISINIVPMKDKAIIKIKDRGSGIDNKMLKNIFTPFYTKKNGGAGLGMAIAKKIITEHSGKIFVESQIRVGTEVTVELPYQGQGEFENREMASHEL